MAPLRLAAFRDKRRKSYLLKCKACGLEYVEYRPSRDSISELYGNEKYSNEVGTDGFNADGTIKFPPHKSRLNKHIMDKIGLYLDPCRLRVLDIGCGLGHFLKTVKENGHEARGVELSGPPAERIREKLGIDVYNGFLEEAQFAGGYFDVIYMGDVLEHIPEPFDTLLEAKRILRPGGIIVIKTPNAACLMDKIDILYLKLIFYARPKKDFFLHHLYRFTPFALKKGIEKRGFKHLETNFFHEPIRTRARGVLRNIIACVIAGLSILPSQRISFIMFIRKE